MGRSICRSAGCKETKGFRLCGAIVPHGAGISKRPDYAVRYEDFGCKCEKGCGADRTCRDDRGASGQYDTLCTQDLFSQGQWQLLSIARAAAAEPEILLLDEITANLDAETEKMVLNALRRVSKNRTVISISHRTMAETGRVIPIS